MIPMKILVKIELFGAFRQFTKQNDLELSLEQGTGLAELRKALEGAIQSLNPQASRDSIQSLIGASAFADETAVLSEGLCLDRDMTLAVLPPVCGG